MWILHVPWTSTTTAGLPSTNFGPASSTPPCLTHGMRSRHRKLGAVGGMAMPSRSKVRAMCCRAMHMKTIFRHLCYRCRALGRLSRNRRHPRSMTRRLTPISSGRLPGVAGSSVRRKMKRTLPLPNRSMFAWPLTRQTVTRTCLSLAMVASIFFRRPEVWESSPVKAGRLQRRRRWQLRQASCAVALSSLAPMTTSSWRSSLRSFDLTIFAASLCVSSHRQVSNRFGLLSVQRLARRCPFGSPTRPRQLRGRRFDWALATTAPMGLTIHSRATLTA
mmetsp:Transcript_12380/g.40445  ORF Transcript_12380/g.40445 Transcript_12380/m.40445 type:complete len:276 (-) Transcript_12380:1551-2378(-)